MAVTKEISPDKDWQQEILEDLVRHTKTTRWLRDSLLSFGPRIHLAIFNEPYLSYILEGRKTIESRFSVNRCAPYEHVSAGDVLLLKRSGGPIVAACVVDCVWFYVLDETAVKSIRSKFAKALCAQDPSFWEDRIHAKFATLMRIRDVVELGPIECAKRDRRGWVVLQEGSALPFSLEDA